MDSSPENFHALKKLLRLKRYEQPPPRYFREFSSQVIARIEAGDAREGWWERFGFDVRPALTAAAGMVACGLIFFGVGVTVDADTRAVAENVPYAPLIPQPDVNLAATAQQDHAAANSTNPVFSSQSVPLPTRWGTHVMPASFRVNQ